MVEAVEESQLGSEDRWEEQRSGQAIGRRQRNGAREQASMIAAACMTKLRVRTYIGFGRPVDPDVKCTMPGAVRKDAGRIAPDGGRASGRTKTRSPRGSPAPAIARSEGGRNSGVPGGTGGELRQAVNPAVGGIAACRKSSHPSATAASSSDD